MNKKAIRKELTKVRNQEDKFIYKASNSSSMIADKINNAVPDKILTKIEGAFGKAFNFMYVKGSKAINKTYSQDKMKESYEYDKKFAKAANNRLSLKSFQHKSARRGLFDGFIVTVTGLGLGFLGRALIDITAFISVTFRNMYQTCLCYGFDCDDFNEKILMLKMMETSLTTGEDVEILNHETDDLIEYIDGGGLLTDDDLDFHVKSASERLSKQIMYTRVIMMIPILGIVPGFLDIVYFYKVHKYIDMKYRKRFLMGQLGLTKME